MRDYSTARGLFGFMGFIGWAAIIVGLIVAMIGGAGGSSFGREVGPLAAVLAAMPGLMLALSGFLIVAFVEIGRAGIDTAENTQEALAVGREQLQIMKAGFAAGTGGLVGTASTKTAASFDQKSAAPTYAATSDQAEPARQSAGAADKLMLGAFSADAGRQEPKMYGMAPALETIEYRGSKIRRTDEGFFVGMLQFERLEPAKAFLDEQVIRLGQIPSN